MEQIKLAQIKSIQSDRRHPLLQDPDMRFHMRLKDRHIPQINGSGNLIAEAREGGRKALFFCSFLLLQCWSFKMGTNETVESNINI